MSRSYTVLAVALVGAAGLAGGVRLFSGDGGQAGTIEIVDEAASDDLPDQGLEPVAVIDPDCTFSVPLELGDADPEVVCLESRLVADGALGDVVPDEVFDEATDAAVRTIQGANGFVVDGIVGPRTANQLGSWAGPDVLLPTACPETGRSAVIDRTNQRSWLCEVGEIVELMPMTSAISQPTPGTYEVYAKDLNAASNISGEYSEMTHFVAFTYGNYQGARIAFHSVPHYPNGEYVQPLDSLGTAERWGESSGCIRVLPEHAELIWSWLDIGDTVEVIT